MHATVSPTATSSEEIAAPSNGINENNKLYAVDRPAHDWYRFVLSFPPHLVREYLGRWGLDEQHRVLDPFCGTGTTPVECKKQGIPSVGTEANPVAHFAGQVKTDWTVDPDGLLEHSSQIAQSVLAEYAREGIEDDTLLRMDAAEPQLPRHLRLLPTEQWELLLTNSISPLPLHKTLTLLECLNAQRDERYHRYQRLALAKVLPELIGNLHFGPEVGVGPAKVDAPVVATWLDRMHAMASDSTLR